MTLFVGSISLRHLLMRVVVLSVTPFPHSSPLESPSSMTMTTSAMPRRLQRLQVSNTWENFKEQIIFIIFSAVPCLPSSQLGIVDNSEDQIYSEELEEKDNYAFIYASNINI